jgi:hypothetical protein
VVSPASIRLPTLEKGNDTGRTVAEAGDAPMGRAWERGIGCWVGKRLVGAEILRGGGRLGWGSANSHKRETPQRVAKETNTRLPRHHCHPHFTGPALGHIERCIACTLAGYSSLWHGAYATPASPTNSSLGRGQRFFHLASCVAGRLFRTA